MTSTVAARHSLKTKVTLGMLAIFALGFWSFSYYANQLVRQDIERLLGEQQLSTASFIAAEVNRQLDDRVRALDTVARQAASSLAGDTNALQVLLEQRPVLDTMFNGGVIAYGPDGTALADSQLAVGRIGTNYMDIDTVASALKEGRTTVGRPVVGKKLLAPVFTMAVPIRNNQGEVVGALGGVTNLGQANFLDRVSQSPYGENGGYHLLVAPQSRQIVTASDKSRVMEMIPAPGINPSYDRFYLGRGASGVVTNPLGVEVLSASAEIPTSGWYVMVSLPTAIAFAPIHAMQQRRLLATLFLTLLAVGLTWWLLGRQLAPLLAAAGRLSTMSGANQPLQSLPIARNDEVGELIGGFNRLLETLAQREQALRIAATAFECQEGMIITDANRVILRTNHSFTRIMGYTNEEVIGKNTSFMRSDRHPASFYDAAWETARQHGTWRAEVWHRRKNGEVFPQWLTSTGVKDARGNITHYVVTHVDITRQKQREAQRVADEVAHRDTLVREVHHRIKNNLQGITSLLRQFAQNHPETAAPMNQAIGQVQGISVIHGLQGGANRSSVRLCELTSAIASEIQGLWQIPLTVDIPPLWTPCVITETEAVPIALVLNELMVNAVKHGGKALGYLSITLRKGPEQNILHVTITNAGQLHPDDLQSEPRHNGLKLVAALMPRNGARIVRAQQGDRVVTLLELAPPVITLDQREFS